MFDKLRLIVGAVLAMRPALRRAYGSAWPLALVRCALHTGSVIRRTRWAGRKDAEAQYVRTLALLPVICLDVRSRLGERSGEIMRELTAAVVEAENERVARKTGLFEISDLAARWHAYFDRTLIHGVGAFNENECVCVEPERFHYRVFRCVFAEMAREIGVPELGRIVCDLDMPFHRRLFPSYEFHRCGSTQNTLAYGHSCCEYVWDRRNGHEATQDGADAAQPAGAQALTPSQPCEDQGVERA